MAETQVKGNGLAWGMKWLELPPYRAAFGARMIADRRGLDCLADRVDWDGEPEARTELNAWLKKVIPWSRWFEGSDSKVYSVDDGQKHLRFTPNRSYGYLYVTAWLDADEEPEPEPEPEPEVDDGVRCCPECEKPNQFGELCEACRVDAERERYYQDVYDS